MPDGMSQIKRSTGISKSVVYKTLFATKDENITLNSDDTATGHRNYHETPNLKVNEPDAVEKSSLNDSSHVTFIFSSIQVQQHSSTH